MYMNANSTRETFHLFFLRYLSDRWASGARPWAVKGGCALRFFFRSPRYSVDLDIDAPGFSIEALRGSFDACVGVAARSMAARGLGTVEAPSFPKAGQNVLRMKILLRASNGEEIPTQVEASRRGMPLSTVVVRDKVSTETLVSVGLPPFVLPTYSRAGMLALKALALARRTTVRDVYDFAHLLPADPPLDELRALSVETRDLVEAARWVVGRDAGSDAFLRDIEPYLGGDVMDFRSWEDARERTALALTAWSESLGA